jgi:hypothetical protein
VSRVIDWEQWKTHRRALSGSAAAVSERLAAGGASRGSTRERDPQDAAIITRMIRFEIERREAEGRLVRLGPREYELHPRRSR